MKHDGLWAALAFYAILSLASPLASESDWSKPETIDPFEDGIGDFLDTDRGGLVRNAYEAYQSGDYEKSAKYHLALLRLDITDAGTIYNLACCYGLLGRDTLASIYLVRAFNAGFTDVEHTKRDPDFDKIRGKEIFDAAVDSLELVMDEKRKAAGRTVRLDAKAFFKYHVQVPTGYDSSKTYPLVVGLHGLGANPDRFIRLWERFDEPQFIFASPQAPYPYIAGGEPGYTWHLWEPGLPPEKVKSVSADYVVRVIENLREAHTIGDIYLLGFSQGCAQTYMTGIKHASLFRGLVCFGGWMDDEYFSEEMLDSGKELRIFIAHGRDDRSVEFESGVKARDILEKHGYDVTFHEFEGGHRVPQDPLRAAQKWMFSQ